MDRKLCITFHLDRSVEYHFSRNERALSRYVIEHPAEQVLLLHADPGYKTTVDANGWLRLSWENNLNDGWSTVHYRKIEKLRSVDPANGQFFSFWEDIKVKSQTHFGLWLGSKHGPLSAVKARSRAVFRQDGAPPINFKPRELEEEVFRTSGLLEVRWVLEPLLP